MTDVVHFLTKKYISVYCSLSRPDVLGWRINFLIFMREEYFNLNDELGKGPLWRNSRSLTIGYACGVADIYGCFYFRVLFKGIFTNDVKSRRTKYFWSFLTFCRIFSSFLKHPYYFTISFSKIFFFYEWAHCGKPPETMHLTLYV